MARNLYLFLVVVVSVSCSPVKYVTQNRVDVLVQTFRDMPEYTNNHKVFWDYVSENNPEYNQYLADTRKSTIKIRKQFEQEKLERLDARRALTNYTMSDLEQQVIELMAGDPYEDNIGKLIIEESDYPFAYVDPYGYIVLSSKLVVDQPDGVSGILAHEMAHYVLRHSEVNYVVEKQAERKARNKTNLVAALSMAGAVAAGVATMDTYDNDPATFDLLGQLALDVTYASQDAFYDNAMKINLSYSRDQEIESDIIACLFLMWAGEKVSGYINTLEYLLQYSNPNQQASWYDTHPLLELRINSLREMFKDYL